MARHKQHQQDGDDERMSAAMRRLESLVRETGRAAPAPPENSVLPEDGGAADAITAEHPKRRQRAPRTYQHVWTSKADAGPKPPPARPGELPTPTLKPTLTVELPLVLPANDVGRQPPRRRAFDRMLLRIAGVDDGPAADAVAAESKAFAAATVFSIAIAVLRTAAPLAVMVIVDRLTQTRSFEGLALLIAALSATMAFAFMIELARRRTLARAGAAVTARVSDAGGGSGPAAVRRLRNIFNGGPIAILDAVAAPAFLFAAALIDWRFAVLGTLSLAVLWLAALSVSRRLTDRDAADESRDMTGDTDRMDNGELGIRLVQIMVAGAAMAVAASLAMIDAVTVGAAIAGAGLILQAARPFRHLAPHLAALSAARAAIRRVEASAGDPDRDGEEPKAPRP